MAYRASMTKKKKGGKKKSYKKHASAENGMTYGMGSKSPAASKLGSKKPKMK